MTLRAVIWCAVSTKAQVQDDKDSLPSQEAKARELCETNGWDIVDVLRVPGHSRRYYDIHECADDMAAKGITAFKRLMELWETSAFDVLICRDGNRFARTQSLHSRVTEETIGMGARIYSLADGWVDEKNFRMWTIMNGYKAASEIDELKIKRELGMAGRASRGLPAGRPVLSHRVVRDPNSGKPLGFEVDEDKRRLLDDLATLILEGVSWMDMETQLSERFGHVDPRTGKQYSQSLMYHLVYNPQFWGHQVQGHKSPKKRSTAQGAWAYDESIPCPEGVIIYRNTHPAAYTGELATRIQAELRRREGTGKKRKREYTRPFSGLVVCDECGRTLSSHHFKPRNTRRVYPSGNVGVLRKLRHYYLWSCRLPKSKMRALNREQCPQAGYVNETIIQEYVQKLLEQIVAGQDNPLTGPAEGTDNITDKVKRLDKEIAVLEKQLGQMILDKAAAESEVERAAYTEQIHQAGKRLEILKDNRLRLTSAEASRRTQTRQQEQATETIRQMMLENFWKLTPFEINQLLHQLFA